MPISSMMEHLGGRFGKLCFFICVKKREIFFLFLIIYQYLNETILYNLVYACFLEHIFYLKYNLIFLNNDL